MFVSLAQWNGNPGYSLQTAYLIFEAFEILFPTVSLIFTATELFHSVISERAKHEALPP